MSERRGYCGGLVNKSQHYPHTDACRHGDADQRPRHIGKISTHSYVATTACVAQANPQQCEIYPYQDSVGREPAAECYVHQRQGTQPDGADHDLIAGYLSGGLHRYP